MISFCSPWTYALTPWPKQRSSWITLAWFCPPQKRQLHSWANENSMFWVNKYFQYQVERNLGVLRFFEVPLWTSLTWNYDCYVNIAWNSLSGVDEFWGPNLDSIYKAKFIHPAQRVQVIVSKVFDGLVKGLPNLEGYFFLLIHVFLQEFLQLRRYLVFSICTSGLLSFWHHIAGDMGSWHSKWGLNTTTYGMSVAT